MVIMQERIISELLLGKTEIINDINQDYFYSENHRKIYQAIVNLHSENKQIIIEHIIEYINNNIFSELEKKMLINIIKYINARDFPSIIGDVNEELRIEYESNFLEKIKSDLNNLDYNSKQKIEKLQSSISTLLSNTNTKDEFNYKDQLKSYGNAIKQGKIEEELAVCLEVNNENLKSIFYGGIRPSPYFIVARPKDFKTSFLIDIIADQVKNGKNGLMFSFEDSAHTFKYKLTASIFDVPKYKMERGMFDGDILEEFINPKFKGTMFVIDKIVDMYEMRRIVNKYVDKHNIDFVCLDYIQLARINYRAKKHEELGNFTKEIMEVTKVHKIPFICTAQLSRQSRQYSGEPQLEHIKDCGNIEQDARFIYAIWKSDENEKMENDNFSYRNSKILKNTWGTEKRYALEFKGKVGSLSKCENVYNFKKDTNGASFKMDKEFSF